MPTNPANQCDVNIDQKFIKYGDDKSIVVGDSLGDGENDRIILMSRPEVMQEASRVNPWKYRLNLIIYVEQVYHHESNNSW